MSLVCPVVFEEKNDDNDADVISFVGFLSSWTNLVKWRAANIQCIYFKQTRVL